LIRVVTQISYKEVRMQTCHIFTMTSILFPALLCLFSVHVTECTEIQKETIYTYNYDNKFGDIFYQGALDDFNMMKYTEVDTGYEGPHVGGVFHLEGYSWTTTSWFDGYIVDISTTQYCGGTGDIDMYVYYPDGEQDRTALCGRDWLYNQTWTPATRFSHQDAIPKFRLEIRSYDVSASFPSGFDEIKITTTPKPPQIPTASIPATNNSLNSINEPSKQQFQKTPLETTISKNTP